MIIESLCASIEKVTTLLEEGCKKKTCHPYSGCYVTRQH